MSHSFNVYVGPFLQCKAIPYEQTHEIVKRTEERIWMLPDNTTRNPVWHFWASNGWIGHQYDKDSCQSLTVQPIEFGRVAEEARCFQERHKQEIAIVKEVYGKDNVALNYGVIAYFM